MFLNVQEVNNCSPKHQQMGLLEKNYSAVKRFAEPTLYKAKKKKKNLYQLHLRQETNMQNLQRIAETEYQENKVNN